MVSPNEPTCWCGDNEAGSTIDYAVVGNSIVGYVQAVEFEQADPYQPHRYVRMKLSGCSVPMSEINISKPRGFPIERPIGPPA